MKKIAVIGKKNHLDWDYNVAESFSNLGHEVFHFRINERHVFQQLAYGFIKGLKGKKAAKRFFADYLYKQLKSIKPDLIFCTSAILLGLEYYERFNDLPGKPIVAGWEGDGAQENANAAEYVNFLDFIFDSDLERTQQNTLGFKQNIHLPFAINPRVHKDMHLQRQRGVYFCGAWSGERDLVFSKIENYPLILKGWHFQNYSGSNPEVKIYNGTVSQAKQAADYNSFDFVLNIHQTVNRHLSALNMRAFEAPGCGAVLLSDFRPELSLMYEEGHEILIYRSPEEIPEILARYAVDKKILKEISLNAVKRSLADHTYLKRMKKVLEVVDG